MYDIKVIQHQGRPLFQTAKMVSPASLKNSLLDVACFFYVLNGQAQLIETNGSHLIKKEEGLVKSCGNFISNYLKDDEGGDFEAIVIYFYPDLIKEIFNASDFGFINQEEYSTPPQKILENGLVEKFINGLELYFENEELMDESLAKLKIKELILILLKSKYFNSVVDLFNGLFSSKNKSFRKIIENNLFSNISLDQLAFLTNKSLSTFKRDFVKEFNDTPARYIKNKRLEKAAKLLIVTKKSITDIAFACGFQDLSTFSDIFRNKFNESPSAYRLNQIRK